MKELAPAEVAQAQGSQGRHRSKDSSPMLQRHSHITTSEQCGHTLSIQCSPCCGAPAMHPEKRTCPTALLKSCHTSLGSARSAWTSEADQTLLRVLHGANTVAATFSGINCKIKLQGSCVLPNCAQGCFLDVLDQREKLISWLMSCPNLQRYLKVSCARTHTQSKKNETQSHMI
eukprot:4884948-Amphidinium_carterae.1